MTRTQELIEIDLLLSGIRARYGYDFSQYARSSLHRRLDKARIAAGVDRYTQLLDQLFHDVTAFEHFLTHLSVTVTEIFRDPAFFRSLREQVIPVLKTYPYVKLWLAGCATGEEAYSIAMLLHEEQFLDRARIYATDFNKHSLATGERGVYPQEMIPIAQEHYADIGCAGKFSDYYTTGYGRVKFKEFLRERVTFSYHNLVSDGVFGEMNLILCRNVLIYFDHELQERALGLFDRSLRHGGFLCLGNKETLHGSALQPRFTVLDGKQKIYRKTKESPAHAC